MLKGIYRTFNRGEVDKLALARQDVAKVQNSGSLVENFLPIRLGPMKHAPGVEDLGSLAGEGILIPFLNAIDSTALVEVTEGLKRIWVDGELIERQSVTSTLPDLAAWSVQNDVTIGAGGASLVSSAGTAKLGHTIANTQIGSEHGLRIVIAQGSALVSLGTNGDESRDLFSGLLSRGSHSLNVTPTGPLTITIESEAAFSVIIEEVSLESGGIVEIATDFTLDELRRIRWAQSADTIFATRNGAPFRIERRGETSWSCVEYETNYGPFGFINNTATTMSFSGQEGDITITASTNYFEPDMVGSQIRAITASQLVTQTLAAGDATDSVQVTGVGAAREFSYVLSNVTGDIFLETSADDATWQVVETFDESDSDEYDDGLDNSIVFYRFRADGGASATATITYSGGSSEGVARITRFISPTSVNAIVLDRFGSLDATVDWYISAWRQDEQPTALHFYEGRLWFAGMNEIWGSESDNYFSFDRREEGGARSILRTIGFGAVDTIYWLAPAVRLAIGTALDEISIRSSSFNEIITQDNAHLKAGPEQGCADIPPVTFDNNVYYIHRSREKLLELSYNSTNDSHLGSDLTYLNQDIGRAKFRRVARSREPDTRLYCVMEDGTVRIALIDNKESLLGWSRRAFPYPCVDVAVLPADGEDEVYYVLNVNGDYRLQKQARISDAHLYPVDMFKRGNTGLEHLEGEEVDIWVNGARVESEVVTGGQVSQGDVVGKKIIARWTSNKLGHYVDRDVLNEKKRVVSLGVTAANLWHDGLRYGGSFERMYRLPQMYKGSPIDMDRLVDCYDTAPSEFEGEYDSDSRIFVTADAPVTILGLSFTVDTTNDPSRQ